MYVCVYIHVHTYTHIDSMFRHQLQGSEVRLHACHGVQPDLKPLFQTLTPPEMSPNSTPSRALCRARRGPLIEPLTEPFMKGLLNSLIKRTVVEFLKHPENLKARHQVTL